MVPELSITDSTEPKEAQPCRKCKTQIVEVKLTHRDGMCKSCFLNYVRHKFRATLGSTKIVPKNSRVLMLADGSAQSVALLDMVKFGVEDELFKKLHVIIGGVLVIDDLTLCGLEELERQRLLNELHTSLEYLSMPLYLVAVTDEKIQPFESKVKESPTSNITSRFDQVKSLTERQDLLHQIKRRLILKAANELNCPFVFTNDIGLDIAQKLLTNISLGRGAGVTLDVGFCDDRWDSVKIIRPLRDLVPLEVENYLKLNNLKPVVLPKYGAIKGDSASIENLTAAFVNNLQKQFPSTVSTVFKTGDRLKATEYENKGRCRVCQSGLDCAKSETLFAIEYSRIVAEHADKHLDDTDLIQQEANKRVHGADRDYKAELCYSCRNIIIEGTDLDEIFGEIS